MGLDVAHVGYATPTPILIYPPLRIFAKVVVQATAQRVGRRVSYRLYCSECGEYIGDIDARELQSLMTGLYGKVICFICEDRWQYLFSMSPCEYGVIWQ